MYHLERSVLLDRRSRESPREGLLGVRVPALGPSESYRETKVSRPGPQFFIYCSQSRPFSRKCLLSKRKGVGGRKGSSTKLTK